MPRLKDNYSASKKWIHLVRRVFKGLDDFIKKEELFNLFESRGDDLRGLILEYIKLYKNFGIRNDDQNTTYLLVSHYSMMDLFRLVIGGENKSPHAIADNVLLSFFKEYGVLIPNYMPDGMIDTPDGFRQMLDYPKALIKYLYIKGYRWQQIVYYMWIHGGYESWTVGDLIDLWKQIREDAEMERDKFLFDLGRCRLNNSLQDQKAFAEIRSETLNAMISEIRVINTRITALNSEAGKDLSAQKKDTALYLELIEAREKLLKDCARYSGSDLQGELTLHVEKQLATASIAFQVEEIKKLEAKRLSALPESSGGDKNTDVQVFDASSVSDL